MFGSIQQNLHGKRFNLGVFCEFWPLEAVVIWFDNMTIVLGFQA